MHDCYGQAIQNPSVCVCVSVCELWREGDQDYSDCGNHVDFDLGLNDP